MKLLMKIGSFCDKFVICFVELMTDKVSAIVKLFNFNLNLTNF